MFRNLSKNKKTRPNELMKRVYFKRKPTINLRILHLILNFYSENKIFYLMMNRAYFSIFYVHAVQSTEY